MTYKPDPWQFQNTDKALVSPDGSQKLVYYDLSEIAMGAPIGGPCFLESDGHPKIKINDWCAGPPVWEKAGRLLAVPIWTRNAESGITQRIGIVDTHKLTLTVFKKKFRVLDSVHLTGLLLQDMTASSTILKRYYLILKKRTLKPSFNWSNKAKIS
jgi:hypothetical protein